MAGIRRPMEEAFAKFVKDQQAARLDGMWLTLHQFDSSGYDVVYERTPLAEVGDLRLEPRESTPLVDSLFAFGTFAQAVIDSPDDETERLLLVIITDGQENASRAHTWAEVRALLQSLDGPACELIWLGTTAAILEAQDQMQTFTQAGAATSYSPTADGVGYAVGAMRSATMSMRAGSSAKLGTMSYMDSTVPDVAPEQDDALTAEALQKLKAASVTAKR